MGGNSPQALVNATARQILAGELDVAILVGGEAWRTRMRAGATVSSSTGRAHPTISHRRRSARSSR